MLHENASPASEDLAADYKRDLGVKMVIIYAIIYVGFVAINVISPVTMEMEIILGLNLAVVYGFGLIIVALVMALIYNSMCNAREASLSEEIPKGEDK